MVPVTHLGNLSRQPLTILDQTKLLVIRGSTHFYGIFLGGRNNFFPQQAPTWLCNRVRAGECYQILCRAGNLVLNNFVERTAWWLGTQFWGQKICALESRKHHVMRNLLRTLLPLLNLSKYFLEIHICFKKSRYAILSNWIDL